MPTRTACLSCSKQTQTVGKPDPKSFSRYLHAYWNSRLLRRPEPEVPLVRHSRILVASWGCT
jgi:hypothetical protein